MNSAGEIMPRSGMAPAQQRLATGDAVAAQVDQRLVVDFEAAIDEGVAQVLLQRKTAPWRWRPCRLEEAIGAPAVRLGAVHRQVGVLDQLSRSVPSCGAIAMPIEASDER